VQVAQGRDVAHVTSSMIGPPGQIISDPTCGLMGCEETVQNHRVRQMSAGNASGLEQPVVAVDAESWIDRPTLM